MVSTEQEAQMSSDQTQVSATISASTEEALDLFTERRGLEKNLVVEQPLLLYLAARSELPDDALIPARLVLDLDGFDRLVALIETPPEPTQALRDLMHGR